MTAIASLSETPAKVLYKYAGRTVRNADASNAVFQSKTFRTSKKKKIRAITKANAG